MDSVNRVKPVTAARLANRIDRNTATPSERINIKISGTFGSARHCRQITCDQINREAEFILLFFRLAFQLFAH